MRCSFNLFYFPIVFFFTYIHTYNLTQLLKFEHFISKLELHVQPLKAKMFCYLCFFVDGRVLKRHYIFS